MNNWHSLEKGEKAAAKEKSRRILGLLSSGEGYNFSLNPLTYLSSHVGHGPRKLLYSQHEQEITTCIPAQLCPSTFSLVLRYLCHPSHSPTSTILELYSLLYMKTVQCQKNFMTPRNRCFYGSSTFVTGI